MIQLYNCLNIMSCYISHSHNYVRMKEKEFGYFSCCATTGISIQFEMLPVILLKLKVSYNISSFQFSSTIIMQTRACAFATYKSNI